MRKITSQNKMNSNNTIFNLGDKEEMSLEEFFDRIPEYDDDDDEIVWPPYFWEFEKWVIIHKDVTPEYASKLTDILLDTVEYLYDFIGFSLYAEFENVMRCGITEESAVDLVDKYIDELNCQLELAPDLFNKRARRALLYYRSFVAEKTGAKDPAESNSFSIPHDTQFVEWLENSLNMDYENATKVLSSLRNSVACFRPIFDMDFDPFAEAISFSKKESRDKMREYIIDHVETFFELKTDSKVLSRQECMPKRKTVKNAISNMKCYFNFLNDMNK